MSSSLKSLSHHAYYLVGSAPIHAELLYVLEKDHSIPVKANPDLFNRSYINFTIEDARELKLSAGTRPIGATGKKVFVLMMNSITAEAQNALLKLLEEPSDYSHFFLIVPSAHILLPTVKSRMQSLQIEIQGEKQGRSTMSDSGEKSKYTLYGINVINDAKEFLSATPSKRLELIKALLEDITKEKKTKQDAITFLNAIECVVHEEKGIKDGMKQLEAIQVARKYISDRAPSMKMLLEYVALNI